MVVLARWQENQGGANGLDVGGGGGEVHRPYGQLVNHCQWEGGLTQGTQRPVTANGG